MDDLIAFIRSCLDDDERAARAAAVLPYGSAKWFAGAEGSVFGIDQGSDMHVRGAVLSLDDIGEHIARWDPARVLAEIEAKRKLLNAWADQWWVAADIARMLALPYADRDGYREEWRP